MKQSRRISLLVSSITVTAALGVVMVATRPKTTNEMIEIARQRQLQPLLEVDEPARLSKTVEDERRQEAEDLYPYLQEKILNDQAVSDHLLSVMESEIDKRVNAAVDEKMAGEIESRLAAFRSEIEKQLAEQKVWTDEEIDKKLEAYVPQAVDSLIPRIAPIVWDDFNEHKDEYIALLADGLDESTRAKAEEVLDANRDAIVMEAIQRSLDAIEDEIASGRLKVAGSPVPVQPTMKGVDAQPLEAPVFEVWDQPQVMSPDEYKSQRDEMRKQQIKAVVDRLEYGKGLTE